jgi:protein-disulfide isomerase
MVISAGVLIRVCYSRFHHLSNLGSPLSVAAISIEPDAKLIVFGSSDAKKSIVEFGDFQCAPCRRFADSIAKAHLATDVRVEFRNYPLVKIHPLAQRAAELSMAWTIRKSRKDIYDRLMGSPLTKEELDRIEKILRGEDRNFASTMSAAKHALEEEVHQAMALGVKGTPSFFFVNEKGQTFKVNNQSTVLGLVSTAS